MADYKAITTEGWRVSLPFRVLTSKSVLDIKDTEAYNEDLENLYNEQMEIIERLGYDYYLDYITIFGRRDTEGFYSMDEAVQMLALKEGADLVEFENGYIGYVGYYHGFNENYCYFINAEQISEHCMLSNKNEVYVFDDDLAWLYIIKNESEVESAVDLIEWSISAWYNCEEYPEYESVCIGDVIDEQLDDKCIEYKYISIGK